MRHLVCATLPRSGHHFLAHCVSTYAGERLFYCQGWERGDCCRSLPCIRSGGRPVLQKLHDLRHEVPHSAPGIQYLMQYREPVGQLLSYAELLWERNPTALPIGEPEVAERLVARLAVSSVQFLTKWSGPKNALVIRYDRLVAEPALWAARVLDLLGIEVKIARLGEIVAELSKFKPPRAIGQTVDEPYAPRDLSKTLLSPSLIAAYDSTVRERTPFVDWPRSLVTADVSSTFASAYETEAARWMRKRRARDLLAKVLPDPG